MVFLRGWSKYFIKKYAIHLLALMSYCRILSEILRAMNLLTRRKSLVILILWMCIEFSEVCDFVFTNVRHHNYLFPWKYTLHLFKKHLFQSMKWYRIDSFIIQSACSVRLFRAFFLPVVYFSGRAVYAYHSLSSQNLFWLERLLTTMVFFGSVTKKNYI